MVPRDPRASPRVTISPFALGSAKSGAVELGRSVKVESAHEYDLVRVSVSELNLGTLQSPTQEFF